MTTKSERDPRAKLIDDLKKWLEAPIVTVAFVLVGEIDLLHKRVDECEREIAKLRRERATKP